MPKKKFEPSFAAGVLIVDGVNILGVSRQPYQRRKINHDWGLPGGHAKLFENPYDTAVRELREETGLQAGQLAPLVTVPPEVTGSLPFHVYRPLSVVTGKLKTHTREGLVRWCSPEKFLRVHDPAVSLRESNRYILYWGLGWVV